MDRWRIRARESRTELKLGVVAAINDDGNCGLFRFGGRNVGQVEWHTIWTDIFYSDWGRASFLEPTCCDGLCLVVIARPISTDTYLGEPWITRWFLSGGGWWGYLQFTLHPTCDPDSSDLTSSRAWILIPQYNSFRTHNKIHGWWWYTMECLTLFQIWGRQRRGVFSDKGRFYEWKNRSTGIHWFWLLFLSAFHVVPYGAHIALPIEI